MKKINKNTCHYPAGLDNPEKGNSHFTRYSGQARVGQNKKAFTLVELIIVITILAILATIAFVSFQNYTKDARDGNRVSTITNIQKGLELYTIRTGDYPTPEDVYASGYINTNDVLFEVGYIKEDIARMINFSKTPIDPVGENNYYVYGVSYDNNQYQIGATLENLQTNMLVSTTYANSYQAYVVGNYKGVIKKGELFSNPASLILPKSYSGGTNLAQNTYFVTDKGQNLPYKINADTTLTGGTVKASTGIIINEDNWNSFSGKIQDDLKVSPDVIGVMIFGEKEYFTNVKEKGSSSSSSSSSSSGGGDPETPTFPTTCGSGQYITYEQAQANKTSILQDENINNYIGCNITGIGQIAGYTYSGSSWVSKEKMVLVVETTITTDPTAQWGDTTTDIGGAGNITAATNTTTMTGSIYARDGLKNTNAIIASQLAGTTYAAQKCNAKGTGRYLPATEELNQLYCYNNNDATDDGTYYGVGANHADCVNKGYIANNKMTLSNFSATYYWSSTEASTIYSSNLSRPQSFSNGYRYTSLKTPTYAVRCVSRF